MATVSLIQSLASGLVDPTTGAILASGVCRFYAPGTLTPATVYSDNAGATPISPPLVLTAGGTGIVYTSAPVRMIAKEATDTTTKFDVNINTTIDESLFVTSPAFNGGTQTLLSTILDAVDDSFGGSAGYWNYKESSGATERSVKGWMKEVAILVTDFGALGDDSTNNVTAFNNAAAEAIASGTGMLKIPAGTYRLGSAFTPGAAMRIVGDGRGRTILKGTFAGTVVNLSHDGISIADLDITSSGTGTKGIALFDNNVVIERIGLSTFTTAGIDCSTATGVTIRDCSVSSPNAGSGVLLGNNTFAENVHCTGTGSTGNGFSQTQLNGAALINCSAITYQYGISISGSSAGSITINGGNYNGNTTSLNIASDVSRTFFISERNSAIYPTGTGASADNLYVDNRAALTAASGPASMVLFENTGPGGAMVAMANATNYTPIWDICQDYVFTAAGATATINAPSSAFASGGPPATGRNARTLRILLINPAGGCTWTLNAAFAVSAAPAAGANARTGYLFMWSGAAWCECGRGVT